MSSLSQAVPRGARPAYALSAADERQRQVEKVVRLLVDLRAPRSCKNVGGHWVTNSISRFSDLAVVSGPHARPGCAVSPQAVGVCQPPLKKVKLLTFGTPRVSKRGSTLEVVMVQ